MTGRLTKPQWLGGRVAGEAEAFEHRRGELTGEHDLLVEATELVAKAAVGRPFHEGKRCGASGLGAARWGKLAEQRSGGEEAEGDEEMRDVHGVEVLTRLRFAMARQEREMRDWSSGVPE